LKSVPRRVILFISNRLLAGTVNRQLAAAQEDPDDDNTVTLGSLQLKQWRSKAINDTYEPGSTYKIITLAAARVMIL
jgi:cell division protein FtsI/penicillin-binding protein 2